MTVNIQQQLFKWTHVVNDPQGFCDVSTQSSEEWDAEAESSQIINQYIHLRKTNHMKLRINTSEHLKRRTCRGRCASKLHPDQPCLPAAPPCSREEQQEQEEQEY